MKKIVLMLSLFLCSFMNAQEICDNGIDDDGDGLIDLRDSVECFCNGFQTTTVVPSLIPNQSFEQSNCCPTSYSQLNCATGWVQATSATSDYMNTCGFVFGAATNLGLSPPPNGNGFVGAIFSDGYQEYIGSCLLSPMLAGNTYNLTMSIASSYIDGSGGFVGAGAPPPIDITIFGSTTCGGLPLNTLTCPGAGWTPIASQSYTPTNSWGLINFTFTLPTNISSIIIGSPCVLPAGYNGANYGYFYFDNMILNETSFFSSIVIAETGSICSNDLKLTATADSVGGSWQWYKNGIALVGQTNAQLDISANNFGTGKFSVRYTIGNKCEIVSRIITPPAVPSVSFTLANSCLNVASTFSSTSTSTVGISSQDWSFGDGSAGVTGNPAAHTYTTSGTFNVKLVVKDLNSCKDSLTQPITIYPNPLMGISSNTVCFNVNTQFTNTTSIAPPDNITAWAWDFDNNGTTDNTTQSPFYLYPAPGDYTVNLKATSNNGCKDSISLPVKVNALPTATFTPIDACLNTTLLLNNTSSIPAPNTIATYNWQFGANGVSLNNTSANPNVQYNASGVQTISLDITSNTTCTATITQTVMIFPQPVANFAVSSVCQGIATTFTDQSTPLNAITAWAWDYTSNNSIDNNTQNPSFTFPASGTYSTSLIVTSSDNCKDTLMLPVEVWGHAVPDFSYDNACFGSATTFTNTTNTTSQANSGTIISYNWNFDDAGGTDNSSDPSYTFVSGGNTNAVYNVTLTVNTDHNCADSITKPVNVYALPTASFTSDSVCLGATTHFTDNSNGNGNPLTGFDWDFLSDGTTDITGNASPGYIFPAYGNNAISYTVITTPVAGLSCSSITTTLTAWVNPIPNPDFTYVNQCINAQPVSFDATGSSIATGSNVQYNWNYADLSNGTGINVTHTYAMAGTYAVTLTVVSDKGCQASLVQQAEVYQKPLITMSNSNACDKKLVAFNSTLLANSGTVTNWLWDFNNSPNSIEASGQTVNYTFSSAGTHTIALITLTNNNCRDTLTRTIYVDYVPVASFTVDKPSGCLPHCVTFSNTTLPITGPGVNAQWKWFFGDNTTVTDATGSHQGHCYTNNSSSQLAYYSVKLVVTTDKGCQDSVTKPNFITVYPKPVAQFIAGPNPGNVITPLTYFTNQSVDFTKWYWSFGDGPQIDSVNLNPTHFYNSENAATYNSILIVKNMYSCLDTAYMPIEIAPEFAFYIPNAFTPTNNDGINDLFNGQGIGIKDYKMWIFDRWGEMIFQTNDLAKGWDGKAKDKAMAKSDVYVWKVVIKDVLNREHEYVGHVTLVN